MTERFPDGRVLDNAPSHPPAGDHVAVRSSFHFIPRRPRAIEDDDGAPPAMHGVIATDGDMPTPTPLAIIKPCCKVLASCKMLPICGVWRQRSVTIR